MERWRGRWVLESDLLCQDEACFPKTMVSSGVCSELTGLAQVYSCEMTPSWGRSLPSYSGHETRWNNECLCTFVPWTIPFLIQNNKIKFKNIKKPSFNDVVLLSCILIPTFHRWRRGCFPVVWRKDLICIYSLSTQLRDAIPLTSLASLFFLYSVPTLHLHPGWPGHPCFLLEPPTLWLFHLGLWAPVRQRLE